MSCSRCRKRDPEPGASRCAACRDNAKSYHRRLRQQCIDAYGGQCECCGTTQTAFLAIDHINGRGAAHRREIGGSGRNLYAWLKREGFPPGFRVLCHNCNFATYWEGQCPCQKTPNWKT